MRRLGCAVLAGLLFLAGCKPAPSPAPAGKPALWQVEDASGQPLAWLFGTIHRLPDGARWRTPLLDRSMARAGVLVVEVRDLEPGAIAPVFASLAGPCACPPLVARVSPEKRPQLAALMDEAEVVPGALDRTETWAAALSLAGATEWQSAGPGADVAVIEAFRGRPVEELEGAAVQLEIFDRLAEAAQRRMLAEVLSAHANGDADALAAAWLSGNAERIAAETRKGLLDDPDLRKALLLDRNAAWLAKLAPLVATGRRPFVAVGAAHLVGPDGLVARLAAQGLVVRRIQ